MLFQKEHQSLDHLVPPVVLLNSIANFFYPFVDGRVEEQKINGID